VPILAADLATALAERLRRGEPYWFPGLAQQLAQAFEQEDAESEAAFERGPPPQNSHPVIGHLPIAVEPLPAAFARRFNPPAPDITPDRAAAAIASALDLMAATGPGAAVASLVRSVHVIGSRGPGYDCSHSEPSLSSSVFVSVPVGERDARLRLAESLLHEAMHLQLSLIERFEPLVADARISAFSPWQQRPRPLQGLLHGLYVFRVIDQWLGTLPSHLELDAGARNYAARRRAEIGEEIAEVAGLAERPGLTSLGRELARSLICARLPIAQAGSTSAR